MDNVQKHNICTKYSVFKCCTVAGNETDFNESMLGLILILSCHCDFLIYLIVNLETRNLVVSAFSFLYGFTTVPSLHISYGFINAYKFF
jgi:hypothetical protein